MRTPLFSGRLNIDLAADILVAYTCRVVCITMLLKTTALLCCVALPYVQLRVMLCRLVNVLTAAFGHEEELVLG